MRSAIPFLKKRKTPPIPTTLHDLLGIEGIKSGIVIRKGRYIMLLEVMPVNFQLKSIKEQAFIISCYEELLKIIKTDFQITTIARKADIGGHIKYMEKCLKAERDEDIQRQIMDYMKFAQDISGRSAVSRRFILVIPYVPPAGVKPEEVSFDTALNALLEIKGRVKQTLHKCGNELAQPDNADQHTAEILYSLLNRKSSETQSLPLLNGGLF